MFLSKFLEDQQLIVLAINTDYEKRKAVSWSIVYWNNGTLGDVKIVLFDIEAQPEQLRIT